MQNIQIQFKRKQIKFQKNQWCLYFLFLLQLLSLNQANIFSTGPFRNIQLQNINESITTEYSSNNEWEDMQTIDMGNNNCFSFAVTCGSLSDTFCDLETGASSNAQGFAHQWYFNENLTVSPTRILVDDGDNHTISSCYINNNLVVVITSKSDREKYFAKAFNTSGVQVWSKVIFNDDPARVYQGVNCISINGGTEVLIIAQKKSNEKVFIQTREITGGSAVIDSTYVLDSSLGFPHLLKDKNGNVLATWNKTKGVFKYAFWKNDNTGFDSTQNIGGEIPNFIRTKYKMKPDLVTGQFILLGDDQEDLSDIQGQYYLLDTTITYVCTLPQLSINYRIMTPTVEIYNNVIYTVGYNQHSQNFVGNFIDVTGANDQTSCNSLSWVENIIDTGKGALQIGHKFTSTLTITASKVNMEIFYAQYSKPYQMTYTIPQSCLFACDTCSDLSSCDTCKGDRVKNGSNLCLCTAVSNTYDDGSSTNCQTCQIQCAQCSGTADNCSTCQGANREDTSSIPKCKCSELFYQLDTTTQDCQPCPHQCQTCQSASLCDTCATGGNRDSSTDLCDCISHYFNDGTNTICLECNYKCLECSGSPTNCDSCQGTNRQNNFPTCSCEIGYFDDGSNANCVKCNYTCNSCIDLITKCDSCNSSHFRIIDNNTCPCNPGYYDVANEPICGKCLIQCAECSGTSDNCSICQGANRENTSSTPKCKCSDQFYQVDLVTADCDSCLYTCQTCENGNECLTCYTGGNRVLGTNKLCDCAPGYVNEGLNPLCIQCNYRCDECSVNRDNCDNCLQGYKRILIAPDCECEYGYYDDGSNLDCVQCDLSCLDCISITCQICTKNRKPITGNLMQCGCPSEDITDLEYFSRGTYSCTTCTFGVYELQFVSLDEINIIFFENITLKDIEDQDVLSIDNCQFIFRDITIFGQSPKCNVIADKIIVQFSYISRMTFDTVVDHLFNPGIIHRENCPTDKYFDGFEQLLPSTLKSPDLDTIPQPELFLLGDLTEGKVFSTLLDINIEIDQQNIINDGKQKMKLLTYTLKLQQSDEVVFSSLMSQFNGLESFTIPKLTLADMTKFKLVVDYQNFLGVSNQKVINFETLDKSDFIYISPPKNPNLQFTIWNYQILEFDVKFTSYQNGKFVPIKKDFKYSVFQTDQNFQVIDNLLIDELKPGTTSVISYNIKPYTHQNIGIYYMKVQIESLDGNANGSSVNFQYNMIPTQPISYIVGGNRIASYSESLQIKLKQKDVDVKENQDQGFINVWQCKDFSINDVCKDIQNNQVALDINGNSQQFDRKLFKPYSILQFTVDITKNIHNFQTIVVIVITDTDLPNFTVNLPEQTSLQKINYQNELQIDLLYPSAQDSPDLSYNMMFIYKFEKVALKVFEYSQFSFKIWDYFQDFDPALPEFVLRVTLYDPNFFMPAESSFNIQVNTPPVVGGLIITPNSGISMDTLFKIEVINSNDIDLPITYRYYYYKNEGDYNKETKDGNQSTSINKNLLKDTTSKDSINSYLVQNNEQDVDLFIMVSVIDGLGGITNVTQSVNVQPIQSQQQYQNLQSKYVESQQLDQNQQIDQLNLISVEMDQIYQKQQLSVNDNTLYYTLKLQIYQQLMEIKNNNLPQNLKDQVLKSINLFIKDQDFQNKQQDTEIQGLLNDFDSILDDIQDNVSFMVNERLINQGDAEISKRQFQSQSLLGKSLNIFDNIAKKQGKSDSSLENSINLQKKLEKTGQIYHQIVLPNSDPIQLEGEESNIFIQKQTQSKTSQKYFNDSQNPFGLLNDDEDEILNSGFEQDTNSDDKKIYKVQFNGFKKNIFKNDQNFEYKDQDNMVQDLQIQDSSNINNTNIDLDKSLNLYFEPSNIDYDSEKQIVEQKCIQKQNNNWKNDSCNATEEENNVGQVVVKCQCKKLGPTTVASVTSDITNLLKDSNLEEAFSGDGLSKLAEFKFYEAIIFYVYTVSCFIFIILIIKGVHWDKHQMKKQVVAQPLTQVAILTEDQSKQFQFQQQQEQEQSNTQNNESNDQKQNSDENQKKFITNFNIVQNQNSNNQNDTQNNSFQQNQDTEDIPEKKLRKRKTKGKQTIVDSPLQSSLSQNKSSSNISTQGLKKKRKQKKKSMFNKLNQEPEPENDNLTILTSKSKEIINTKVQGGFTDAMGEIKSKYNITNSNSNESPKNNNNISSNSIKQLSKNSEDDKNVIINIDEITNQKQSQSQKQNSDNQDEIQLQENLKSNLNLQSVKSNQEGSDTSRQLIITSSNLNALNKKFSDKNTKQISFYNEIGDEIKQEDKLPDPDEQKSKQEKEQKIDIKLLIGMLFFHDFSSIFIVFMDTLPRPVRFVLFYVRILLVMSISALFAGNYSPYQEILINIILSFFVTVPHIILQTLFKCKNKIAKTLVFILCICIFLLSIYMGLVGAAFLGVEKSNQWTINFVTSQLFDVFLIQSLVGVIKTTILIAVLHNKTARAQKIRKALLKEQGQQFLYQQTKLNNISEQKIKEIDLK